MRRVWLRDRLWELLGVKDGRILAEKEIIWRGTRRTAEFVFGNVRDARDVPDEQFAPATEGNIRFVVDYPFDEDTFFPSYDYQRVKDLIKAGHEAPTLVWLPDFFSEQRKAQLGRLMRILFLLERDRLAEYTRNYPPDDRAKARRQLEVGRETLTRTLTGALAEVYGIATVKDGTRGAEVPDGEHVLSLEPRFRHPQPEGGKTFSDNVRHLADGLFAALHPQHPDFGKVTHSSVVLISPGPEVVVVDLDPAGRSAGAAARHPGREPCQTAQTVVHLARGPLCGSQKHARGSWTRSTPAEL